MVRKRALYPPEGFLTKEADPDPLEGEKFPEVVKEVQKEIKSLGEGIQGMNKNYDDMRKAHESLKGKVDDYEKKGVQFPTDVKEQVNKLATEVATRQEALEKAVHERMDKIETKVLGGLGHSRFAYDGEKMLTGEVVLERKGHGGSVVPRPVFGSAQEAALVFMVAVEAVKRGDKGVGYRYVKELRDQSHGYIATLEHYLPAFEEWVRTDEKMMRPEELKALSVGSDPDGGYTVTPAMSAKVIERLFEMDPIRQLAATETISTSAIEWMVDIDEAGCGWEGETVVGAETKTPEWRKKRIPVHVQYARPRATQTLLEDSGINVESWLAMKIANSMGRIEGARFVDGDGVMKPRGFLTYPNGTSWGQIEQIVVGAAAGMIDTDGLINLKYHLKEMWLARGTWLMGRMTVAAVMVLKDGMGDYIWKPSLIAQDPISSLLGLPLRMSPTMPAVAAGSLSFALADWAEAYMIVDRLGISVQRDPYTVKPFVEFYTRRRVGGDVINYEAIKLGRVNP